MAHALIVSPSARARPVFLLEKTRREQQGLLLLPAAKTKTNSARVVPVGQRLRAELEMRRLDPRGDPHPPTTYVFGNAFGEKIARVITAWRACCRRAGVSGSTFHDLRREFGSRLLESGASQHDVRDLLGHANITTTSRYLATSAGRLEHALAKMERGSVEADRTTVAPQLTEIAPRKFDTRLPHDTADAGQKSAH